MIEHLIKSGETLTKKFDHLSSAISSMQCQQRYRIMRWNMVVLQCWLGAKLWIWQNKVEYGLNLNQLQWFWCSILYWRKYAAIIIYLHKPIRNQKLMQCNQIASSGGHSRMIHTSFPSHLISALIGCPASFNLKLFCHN